jgi:predicted transposase YdaD
LSALKEAAERNAVPHRVAVEMQDVIRRTAENVLVTSKMEVNLTMHTSILETQPWTDYGEVFDKLEARGEARGKAEGEARGKAARDMEIALNAFAKWRKLDAKAIAENLKILGIPEATVEAARLQSEAERARGRGTRPEPEM